MYFHFLVLRDQNWLVLLWLPIQNQKRSLSLPSLSFSPLFFSLYLSPFFPSLYISLALFISHFPSLSSSFSFPSLFFSLSSLFYPQSLDFLPMFLHFFTSFLSFLLFSCITVIHSPFSCPISSHLLFFLPLSLLHLSFSFLTFIFYFYLSPLQPLSLLPYSSSCLLWYSNRATHMHGWSSVEIDNELSHSCDENCGKKHHGEENGRGKRIMRICGRRRSGRRRKTRKKESKF